VNDFWIKVLLSVTTFLLTALCGWLGRQVVKYKKLAQHEKDEALIATIDERLEAKLVPIRTDIEALKHIDNRIDEKI
jgi:hypothetical protein